MNESQFVRVEIALQFDPSELDHLATAARELESQMAPEKWSALVELARAITARSEDRLVRRHDLSQMRRAVRE